MNKFLLALGALALCAVSLHATLFPAIDLNNFMIGGTWDQQVGIAFKAFYSSPIAAVRIYEITQGSGYAGGTGGRIKYEIDDDNAGQPGNVLAEGFIVPDQQYTEWLNAGGFPLVSFPTGPQVVAGRWYHLVMTNLDAQPTVNFISWDGMLDATGRNTDPNDFVEYRPSGDPWIVDTRMVAEPFGVFYANGLKQGNGGYEKSGSVTLCGDEYGFGGLC